ncbi:hypothetical protein JCM1840_002351 [Sporobolomyces johnsonii]
MCGRRIWEGIIKPPPQAASIPDTLEALSLAAFTEVETIRSTIEGLRTRMTGLEGLLLAAFGKAKQEEEVNRNSSRAGQGGAGGEESTNAEQQMPILTPTPSPLSGHTSMDDGFPSLGGDIFVHRLPPVPYSSFSLHDSTSHGRPFPLPSLAAFPSAFPTPSISAMRGPFDLPPPVNASPPLQQVPRAEDLPGPEQTGEQEDSVEEREREERNGEQLREEEVAASISLEFMTSPDGFVPTPLPSSPLFDPKPHAPHPCSLFPTSSSLAAIIPPFPETQQILAHAIDWVGWYHGAVHGPTFRAEVYEFWGYSEETRVEKVNPAWLALLFAQLSAGVRHMTREQLSRLGPYGLNEEEAHLLSKTHLDASLACLYRSDFLTTHTLHAIQAIAVLVVTAQDGAPAPSFSNLFPTLLSLGICLAQDLGLHRLPSEEVWLRSVEGLGLEERARSLIAYETKKRVFWCLTSQDWFSIPYRRTTAVQPTQVTTPLPSNARDEDLMTGRLINRPPSEYTITSNTLIWIQIARVLQQVFAHIDETSNPSYSYVLELDGQMQKLIDSVPAWMREGGPTEHLPPCFEWVRNTFSISVNHKVLTLHRPFFHRAFRDARYEPSRRRSLDASRAILREAVKSGDSRMWTVPYHISAAASVVCLDLFQRGSAPAVLTEQRIEVLAALTTLRSMSSFSAIAARGVALIENLLAEETKLPPRRRSRPGTAAAAAAPGAVLERATKKRRLLPDERDEVDPSLARASEEAAAAPASEPYSSSDGALTSLTTPSPATAYRSYSPLDPALSGAGSGNGGGEYLPSMTGEGGGFNGGARLGGMPTNALGLDDELPPSFLTAFWGAGFDPLEGAITAVAGPPWLDTEPPFEAEGQF